MLTAVVFLLAAILAGFAAVIHNVKVAAAGYEDGRGFHHGDLPVLKAQAGFDVGLAVPGMVKTTPSTPGNQLAGPTAIPTGRPRPLKRGSAPFGRLAV